MLRAAFSRGGGLGGDGFNKVVVRWWGRGVVRAPVLRGAWVISFSSRFFPCVLGQFSPASDGGDRVVSLGT